MRDAEAGRRCRARKRGVAARQWVVDEESGAGCVAMARNLVARLVCYPRRRVVRACLEPGRVRILLPSLV